MHSKASKAKTQLAAVIWPFEPAAAEGQSGMSKSFAQAKELLRSQPDIVQTRAFGAKATRLTSTLRG
eukprot:scaffold82431_cov40-Phaeocystis_antarctica.AAC.1